MKARFESKWANNAARVAITLVVAGSFFLIRPDIQTYATDHLRANYHRDFVSPKIIAEYLRQNSVRKLQIGAGGSNAQGWLNTDIEPTAKQAYLDATAPMPFSDGSIHYIFGEHIIEHLTLQQGLGFLKESHRVLAPGGKVRMVTPNLLKFIALFQEQTPENKKILDKYIAQKLDFHFWSNTPDNLAFILNQEMHSWGHQFVYSPAMLRASFEKAGFTQIRQYAAGETDDPVLKGMEIRAKSNFKDMNLYEAMVFEATR